jgi:hypothetical protein
MGIFRSEPKTPLNEHIEVKTPKQPETLYPCGFQPFSDVSQIIQACIVWLTPLQQTCRHACIAQLTLMYYHTNTKVKGKTHGNRTNPNQ